MPVCSLAIVTLQPSISIPTFLHKFRNETTTENKPLIISKVIRWMITPTKLELSPLLEQKWDLLMIFPPTSSSSSSTALDSFKLQNYIAKTYTLTIGVPSSILSSLHKKNRDLLHPPTGSIPPLTGSLKPTNAKIAKTTQNLEFTPGLDQWIRQSYDPYGTKGAVSMLNLLHFRRDDGENGRKHRERYAEYGRNFAKYAGSKRGGDAKVVGKVITSASDADNKQNSTGKEEGNKWDEVALAHYPSIYHFADMAASAEYQEINKKYRLPSLGDTCILMTSEVDEDVREAVVDTEGAGREEKSKL